jgi:hypothetical protein
MDSNIGTDALKLNRPPGAHRDWLRSVPPGLFLLLSGSFAILLMLDQHTNLFRRTWTDQKLVAIDFEVGDAGGSPLEGARIELVSPGGDLKALGRTGPDGKATLEGWFSASGSRRLFAMGLEWAVAWVQLRILADGFVGIDRRHQVAIARPTEPHPRIRYGLTPLAPPNSSAKKAAVGQKGTGPGKK